MIDWKRARSIFNDPKPPASVWERQFDDFDNELKELATTPHDEIDFGDLWYYHHDLAYVELQPEVFAYLFPVCLMDWHLTLKSNEGCSHGDSEFHYGLLRGNVLAKMTTPTQRKQIAEFFCDSLLERLDAERGLEVVDGGASAHGWMFRFNSVGIVMPIIPNIWESWWSLETVGRAVAAIQYLSGLMYFDGENPVFEMWTPEKGGGGPYLWENDSHIYDTGWLQENADFLARVLTIEFVQAQLVICEEKHMGSRAVVVVCRDADAARDRFGVTEGEAGIVYTRTGRRFFNDTDLETAFLDRIIAAMSKTEFWDKFNTSWACLDCELMPWSAKAQELLRSQYAAVGAAGRVSVPNTVALLQQTADRIGGNGNDRMVEVLNRLKLTSTNLDRFTSAYRQYCWTVDSLDDLKLAPFHLLTTEKGVHVGENHRWHMAQLAEMCQADEQLLLATDNRIIDLTNADEVAGGVQWWLDLTDRGGEGMVVKPLDFITKGKKGLNQPAVKCRGREYLRIIYGPDYDTEVNLKRLRNRHLGRKRSLAIREFALGIEALERFVQKEPLRRVHECVFGVLALESEPVDPRL